MIYNFFIFCIGLPYAISNTTMYLNFENQQCSSNEYYDSISFECKMCDKSKNLHPTVSKDFCTCNNHSIIVGWEATGYPKCEYCLNSLPSNDGSFCIKTGTNGCGKNSIKVERLLNGTKLEVGTCIKCVNGTLPSRDQKYCVPCSGLISDCQCPFENMEDLSTECIPKNVFPPWSKGLDMFEIEYEKRKQISSFFRYNMPSAIYWCKMKHQRSCQFLANMCVLTTYQDQVGPCRVYKDIIKLGKGEKFLPQLFYPEGEAQSILNKKEINKKYLLKRQSEAAYIELQLTKWSLKGTWKGFTDGVQELLLCPLSEPITGIRFATDYKISCRLSANDFLKRSMDFFDVYLKYDKNNDTVLYPVPVLNLNYKHGKKLPNKYGDSNQWQLTRRFFIVEAVNNENNNGSLEVIPRYFRYMKSVTLRIRVRSGVEEGMIYTPLLIVSYGEFTKEDVERNKKETITFNVEFQIYNNVKRHLDIAFAVLCSVSVIWSLIRAWAYTRRSGQRPIDLVAVLHLCIISCGHLANVFFFVISGTAIHAFVYYKCQAIAHVLLPSARLHYLVRTYVIVAFPLKIMEVIVMIWHHVTVDIFLVDWEQPRAQKQTIFSVSAWRTYFVANKWNEIQTVRKTNVLLQLCLVVFFLKVCGLEYWALKIPELHTSMNKVPQSIGDDKVFRLATVVIVYTFVYIIQWAILGGLYERYVKNSIQEFVDICSLANISLFVLSLENYGFYVHGRSAHGFSDTDMATLRKQLRREEEDLVRHRGLVPASDHQTFQILIPPKLKIIYRSLLTNFPHDNRFNITKNTTKGVPGVGGDHTMQAYVTINRFIAAFIEHALKDLDYEVRDKMFFEALLDIESHDSSTNGVFYNDNGHSFDNVLYYGNELTLFTFNIILFCFIEILSQDFLLAAILTGLCDEGVARIRKFCSRKNFAKKALIDEHFLL